MDTRDVSKQDSIAADLQNAVMMHEMAKLRNGQLVSDHPSPGTIVARVSAMRMSLNAPTAARNNILTTQLPPSYPPSDRFLDELQPIRITHMRLGEHHRGSKVTVRVLTPPSRINAIMVAVEDLGGTAVTLQLYHHPSAALFPSEEVIQAGNVLIIKEPFFKYAMDGSYSLRVDHLSDVVWLEASDSRVPDVWRKPLLRKDSKTVRMQGNEAVEKRYWAKALRLYSDAIRHATAPEEAQLAFVNRSFVNLKLNRLEQALLDLSKANELIPPTEKADFREIRALYELGSFDRCLERLQKFTTNSSRFEKRLDEDEGFSQPGPSKLRYSILMDLDDKRAFAGSQAEILTKVIQNLYHNPEYSRHFLRLHHGDYKVVTRDRADGNPIVDSFLAAKIMLLNVFGAPRTSQEALSNDLTNAKDYDYGKGGFGTAGLWVKASYVNHSCVGNCRRSFIGDMQILRATKNMDAGTELLFPYRMAQEPESYEDVQRELRKWGFTCSCALCQARLATPAVQLEKRKVLMKRLLSIADLTGANTLTKRLRLLDELKKTYSASYPAEVPRLELAHTYFSTSRDYNQIGKLGKTVDALLDGLGALGYEITAVWPVRGRAADIVPTTLFEIKQWGLVDTTVPWALFNLHLASKSMAPSLAQTILDFAQTAYSIMVGEKETFHQVFPAVGGSVTR
ncbi:TPR domain-containing protein [Cordyceps javanica]|uniref:TPR domain-containing protein n=1 Tax=Cordyceps javanica TaxID=43265 RepID=A0A545VWP1_9HYPO|nr:TPR domain-containing protein [Cordyceps javanica]TQW06114.1 TPR domain protein [Cordyceps javanica]